MTYITADIDLLDNQSGTVNVIVSAVHEFGAQDSDGFKLQIIPINIYQL